MTAMIIDTLKASNRLKAAGFNEKRATELVETFADGMLDNLAIREDIYELRTELRHEMHSLEQRMTIRLGSMIVAAVGFLVMIDRLFLIVAG